MPGPTYKWLTLWELDRFIKMGYYVGPHLRSILSLILNEKKNWNNWRWKTL